MADKIEIPIKDKGKRGEDGYKYTSVRLKEETIAALDALADKSNRSRNEIITIMLDYCIENVEITETENDKE